MENFPIEIIGFITVNAESKEDAIQQVKDMFETWLDPANGVIKAMVEM